MPTIQLKDGARLEYDEFGEGEPMVLVHGSASDKRSWRAQIAPFAERYRVIVPSRRFHWPNEPIGEETDYSMEQQVDDLEMLLELLDLEPAHLVGHSYGGFLCLLLAVRNQGAVRTLVLGEPPALTLFVSSSPKALELLKLLAARPRTALEIIGFGARGPEPAKRAFRRGDMEGGVRIFAEAVLGRGGYDGLPESAKAKVLENATNVRAEILGSGFLPLESGDVAGVRVPTLLVGAERSVGVFHRLMDRLEELMPNAARVEVPGASHMMHVDNPAAFNAQVLRFLDSLAAPGS